MEVESDRVNLARVILNRKDGAKSAVGGISFNNERSIRNPMRKYQSGGKGRLEGFERFVGFWRKVARNALMSGTSKQNSDVGVVRNESLVEVGKTKERLYILDFSRFRPILDGLNFGGRHGETIF